MNRVFATYSCILFISALFAACDNGVSGETMPGPTPFKSERSPYFLNGTVTSAYGIPIAGAEIHSFFKFSQSSRSEFRTPMKTMPSTNISFSMSNGGWASLKVFRLGTRELIATLVNGFLQPGNYQAVFDAASLTNGFYVYQLITKERFTERLMVLQIDDIESLVRTKPLARTDSEGKFRLPQSLFGLDEEIIITSERGPEMIGRSVVDSVAIVVYQSGKHPLIQWMNINKNGTTEHTYILQ